MTTKPILKLVVEWMDVFRDAGIEPTIDLVRACIRKQLIDSGERMRLDELDWRYPSEKAIKQRATESTDNQF